MKKRAVVLLSGGLDSATIAAIAHEDGYEVNALTFDYGQRHDIEIAAAREVAQAARVARHVVVPIDLSTFGGSALTDDIPVPKGRSEADMADGIPVTYVPARNTIFLSMALAWAEVLETGDIFIGVNARDYSGYPDCRAEYLAAFSAMANLATKGAVEGSAPVTLHGPLIDMTKAEIIALGTRLGVEYALTRSCYDPDSAGRACGACDSCVLRLKGFAEAGLTDSAPYGASPYGNSA
jgi:7-cyano-7-deazaguanine synthase